jgi:hypothetical protein
VAEDGDAGVDLARQRRTPAAAGAERSEQHLLCGDAVNGERSALWEEKEETALCGVWLVRAVGGTGGRYACDRGNNALD